jgi:hypothetical protein
VVSSAGDALSLRQAVLDLRVERGTGVLELMAEGGSTRIYFEHGRPLFAEDGAPGDSFGRLLVRQGSISNDQLTRVIDEMMRAGKGDDPLCFGEAAAGLGVMTQEQVERGLAEYVRAIITRALQRRESQWAFDASPAAAKPPRSLSLDIDPALLESMQAFEKGVVLLRAGQTASAAIELRRASELRRESLEYLLYATWAEARSRSDIPSEADQQTLLDVAQRAKKHDPTFAFASYVIGQLSMWAGDDATAKKWFYEALRLDPKSEAATQVRILARRGTGPSGLSGLWTLPGAAPPAERASAPVSAPPAPRAQAAKGVQPSSAPPARPVKRLVPVAVVLAAFGFVAVFAATRSGPRAGTAPSATSRPAPAPAPAPAPVAAVGVAPPVAVAPREPSPDLTRDKAPASDHDGEGTVMLPSRAAGHRIFVDGHRADTDGKAPLHLRCGPHVIQVGGHGTPERIDLPCRGAIQLE